MGKKQVRTGERGLKKDSQPLEIRSSPESCCGSNLETLVSLVNPGKQQEEKVKMWRKLLRNKLNACDVLLWTDQGRRWSCS